MWNYILECLPIPCESSEILLIFFCIVVILIFRTNDSARARIYSSGRDCNQKAKNLEIRKKCCKKARGLRSHRFLPKSLNYCGNSKKSTPLHNEKSSVVGVGEPEEFLM